MSKQQTQDPWDIPAGDEDEVTTPTKPVHVTPTSKRGKASASAKTPPQSKKATEEPNMAKKVQAKAEATPKAEPKQLSEKEQIALLNPKYRNKVVKVIKVGKKGKPVRVLIACQFQGCKATREIATQDLFQVNFCVEHSKKSGKAKAAKVAPAKVTKTAPAKAAKKGKKA